MPDTSRQTGSTTQTNTTPGIDDILGAAKYIFNSGAAWAPNTTSQVTPFSKQTRAALTGMYDTAHAAASPLMNNFRNVQKTLADGGLNMLQDQQVTRLNRIANSNGLNTEQNTALGVYGDIMGGNGLNAIQQGGSDMLKRIAGGGDLNGNPYLEDVIKRSSGDIANADNLMASLAGRYGSGSHAGVLEKNIGDMSSNLRFNDYQTQQQRMDQAMRDYFNTGTTGYSQRKGAIDAYSDLGTTGFNQRADAIGSLYNAGSQQRQNQLAGTGQLADAYAAALDPYKTMGQVGSALEGKNQQYITDATRVNNENKSSMTDPINWLASLAAGYGGQTNTTNTNQNPFLNAIGGAMKGYDVFGGPLGGIFGGLSGAFA